MTQHEQNEFIKQVELFLTDITNKQIIKCYLNELYFDKDEVIATIVLNNGETSKLIIKKTNIVYE